MEWLLGNLPFVWGLLIGLTTTLISTTAFVVTARNTLSSLKAQSKENGTKLEGVNSRLDEMADKWSDELRDQRSHYEQELTALRNEMAEMRTDFGMQISAASGLAGMARSELAGYQVEVANTRPTHDHLKAMEARVLGHFDTQINRLLQMLSLAIGKPPPAE